MLSPGILGSFTILAELQSMLNWFSFSKWPRFKLVLFWQLLNYLDLAYTWTRHYKQFLGSFTMLAELQSMLNWFSFSKWLLFKLVLFRQLLIYFDLVYTWTQHYKRWHCAFFSEFLRVLREFWTFWIGVILMASSRLDLDGMEESSKRLVFWFLA